ncbi:telomere repeats-binding bouquet formation protein 2-like [Lytechinus variegatus]|uniref:telomere repeats-binding bouquet formation protein 2-like n=1 Tax=Lytechinus variegatus TaxID=7654 RepID=UPI001BB2BD93|nr:telomere repeats-binding bouquet formation protein 2-like [Lytechinus variegatus]
MSSKKLPVFNNLKAWFSSSIPRKMRDLWKKQGGKEVSSVKDAQFIFSSDASCTDTVEIYESEEFLHGFLTIFHSSYIDACLKEKTAHEVAAAQYILLPPDMADDIQQLAFVSRPPNQEMAETTSKKKQDQSRSNKPSKANENTNTNHHQERLSSEPSTSNQREPRNREPPTFAHAADIAFKIDDLSSIPYAKSLPRFVGDIKDFIPGVNGCSLSLKAS